MDSVVTEGRCVDLAVTRSAVAGEPMPFTSLNALYVFEMMLREEGISDFVYDEEKDLFRFPDGRFAFSRQYADVELLQERGYFG